MASMAARMLRHAQTTIAPHLSPTSAIASLTVLRQLPSMPSGTSARSFSTAGKPAGSSQVRGVLCQSPVVSLTSSQKMLPGVMTPLQVRVLPNSFPLLGSLVHPNSTCTP
eukprot:257084-Rhodomonas_salina.2